MPAVLAALALAAQATAPPAPLPAAATAAMPVRLMVLNEVTSRTAHPGDRFVLLLDAALLRDGAVLAPAGARAWGEVVAVRRNGSAGTAGRLSARLLWLETPRGRLPLHGEAGGAGAAAFVQMGAMAAASLGPLAPLALLTRGNDGKLKAGEIVAGVVDADPIPEAAPARP